MLRGDSVIDDSGAYAVLTEQGSSASQMTAANVMVAICKAIRLCMTSSRRSISLHSGKIGRTLPDCSEFQRQTVQIYGYVFHDRNGQNHGQILKNRLFLLNEIYMLTRLPDYCGYWDFDGRKYQTGNASLCTVRKGLFRH